jgi:photosystem II stability/assembly factor-like uncharacterized protein
MSEKLLLATKKGTIIVDRKNGRWTPRSIAHAGMAVSYAARDPRDGKLWACMDNAHWGPALMRSLDDGASWEDASRIVYPKGARYIEQLIPSPSAMEDAGKPIAYKSAALMKVWALGFAGNDQPGVIHAGTLPGGLFTSRDGGETWELNRPLWNHESRGGDLFAGEATSKNQWGGTPAAMAYGDFVPGIHSVVVDPRESSHIYVAVSCAGVVETRDGGETWSACNRGMLNDYLPSKEAEWGHDPHFVTLCHAFPDRLWQQNHSGIFTSDNGARNWKRVSHPEAGVHFGFPIAADAKDSKTAWTVPLRSDQERMTIDAGLFVARTSDGGESWQTFRKGLPQEHCHDVVYRHALDVSGDRVCFGSTTGNLYLSEDRGESWFCVGNNLPPIHSVRFA